MKTALRQLLADHLRPLERAFDLTRTKPLVVMIAGVNGAGKTTSIGKLAHTFQRQGASVLLAAGDTFRAAAREQLVEWGSRNNVSVIAQDGGDPAAVAFDSVNAGRARGMGVVMVDTAGRLPTQLHLMEELKKIRRVIGKADATAPHEVLLVVDGNTGQNALAQIRAFDAAITLTGLVVTKLDGTAKGGTLAAVAAGSQGCVRSRSTGSAWAKASKTCSLSWRTNSPRPCWRTDPPAGPTQRGGAQAPPRCHLRAISAEIREVSRAATVRPSRQAPGPSPDR